MATAGLQRRRHKRWLEEEKRKSHVAAPVVFTDISLYANPRQATEDFFSNVANELRRRAPRPVRLICKFRPGILSSDTDCAHAVRDGLNRQALNVIVGVERSDTFLDLRTVVLQISVKVSALWL